MIYKVRAKLNYNTAKEFFDNLTNGTILEQKPDGPEMVDSMNRASIDDNGDIIWTELCYCPTPLKHERPTVYDNYFSDMQTEPIKSYKEFEGKLFMDELAAFSSENSAL